MPRSTRAKVGTGQKILKLHLAESPQHETHDHDREQDARAGVAGVVKKPDRRRGQQQRRRPPAPGITPTAS